MRKYIGRRGPFTRFAEYHDGRSAEAEHRFFLASLEGQINRVDLRYPPKPKAPTSTNPKRPKLRVSRMFTLRSFANKISGLL